MLVGASTLSTEVVCDGRLMMALDRAFEHHLGLSFTDVALLAPLNRLHITLTWNNDQCRSVLYGCQGHSESFTLRQERIGFIPQHDLIIFAHKLERDMYES